MKKLIRTEGTMFAQNCAEFAIVDTKNKFGKPIMLDDKILFAALQNADTQTLETIEGVTITKGDAPTPGPSGDVTKFDDINISTNVLSECFPLHKIFVGQTPIDTEIELTFTSKYAFTEQQPFEVDETTGNILDGLITEAMENTGVEIVKLTHLIANGANLYGVLIVKEDADRGTISWKFKTLDHWYIKSFDFDFYDSNLVEIQNLVTEVDNYEQLNALIEKEFNTHEISFTDTFHNVTIPSENLVWNDTTHSFEYTNETEDSIEQYIFYEAIPSVSNYQFPNDLMLTNIDYVYVLGYKVKYYKQEKEDITPITIVIPEALPLEFYDVSTETASKTISIAPTWKELHAANLDYDGTLYAPSYSFDSALGSLRAVGGDDSLLQAWIAEQATAKGITNPLTLPILVDATSPSMVNFITEDMAVAYDIYADSNMPITAEEYTQLPVINILNLEGSYDEVSQSVVILKEGNPLTLNLLVYENPDGGEEPQL